MFDLSICGRETKTEVHLQVGKRISFVHFLFSLKHRKRITKSVFSFFFGVVFSGKTVISLSPSPPLSPPPLYRARARARACVCVCVRVIEGGIET